MSAKIEGEGETRGEKMVMGFWVNQKN